MYSISRAPTDIRELIDTAIKVAAYELGCGLPETFFVIANHAGSIKGPQNCHGWCDDRGCFLVNVEGRQPHEIIRTVLHEASHYADSQKYGGHLRLAIKDKETGEERARDFATRMMNGLPTSPPALLTALQQKLHEHRYPLQHLEAWIISCKARGEMPSMPAWAEKYGRSRWAIALSNVKQQRSDAASEFLRNFE